MRREDFVAVVGDKIADEIDALLADKSGGVLELHPDRDTCIALATAIDNNEEPSLTKAEAAAALGITEADIDNMFDSKYREVIFNDELDTKKVKLMLPLTTVAVGTNDKFVSYTVRTTSTTFWIDAYGADTVEYMIYLNCFLTNP